MSESVNLNSVPLVYNPNLIKYPENNRLLFSGESKRLDQFIQQFLELKHKGVITTDQLDLSLGTSEVSSAENRIIFPLHMSNPFIQKEPALMLGIDRSATWFKVLSKLGMGQKLLDFFEPPSHKRFAPAVLLHEDLHVRLEKEALGFHIPTQYNEKAGEVKTIVAHKKDTQKRIQIASQKYKTVMSELSKKGFTEEDIRKLNTLYHFFRPEEFFTTSMEAIVQLKCREEITPPIAKELGFANVKDAKALLQGKLAHYTEAEAKLTNALKEECSKVSPAFKEMMSKIDTHWDDVAPLLLKHFNKVI